MSLRVMMDIEDGSLNPSEIVFKDSVMARIRTSCQGVPS